MSRAERRRQGAASLSGAALLLVGGLLMGVGAPVTAAGGGAPASADPEGLPLTHARGGYEARATGPNHDGPPLAHTGGFGEQTCQECHMDLELNSSFGELSIEGVPERFSPGDAYVLTVVLTGEGMELGGFQGAFRFQEGDLAGTQAGALAPLDDRTIVRSQDAVQYIHHTAAGSRLTPDALASWSFEWVAPSEATPVSFHVAANSANGDNSPFADLIFTAAHVIPPKSDP